VSSAATLRSRLRTTDAILTASRGLTMRPARTVLSAAGIALGIAAIVGVLGLSTASRARLIAQLDALGTNLLQVQPAPSVFDQPVELPHTAAPMLRRIEGVFGAAATSELTDSVVRRSRFIDANQGNGLSVQAADTSLLNVLSGQMRAGRFLDAGSTRYPEVVLGSVAANRLALGTLDGRPLVDIDGRLFAVVGIARSFPLAPDLDRSVLISYQQAAVLTHTLPPPNAIYLRTTPELLDSVRRLVPASADPEHPENVLVSRPSDALAARLAAKSTFRGLFLGLGAVGLIVGGIGIANVMVISVLERRSEIGLRRALGALSVHIWSQFVAEAALLALIGGLAGVALGALLVAAFARSRGWPIELPPLVLAGSLALSVCTGMVAGFYPAARAARLSPTEALRTV
jgi:putative ABC transport system permease protein